ncbi:secreted RxLR effector protein 161-like [Phragmites australis]|uniref:secreted RxLR effector protein 161-like n=1 Tax=Phragmites australis TaxID=29695 RepID=UPI002D767452|nr:secreted RxLR effector protein 161-like [Phragmites australis]
MEARWKLSRDSTAPVVDATEYRRVVGSLRYLVNTRPDLAFSVGYVSRFMEKPTIEHLVVVKRILRYVASNISVGCWYPKASVNKLIGYSDNEHVGDIDTRRSTSGALFFRRRSLVSWFSQKQRVVALSSCEAEYMAATSAACQGVWLAQLLAELTSEEQRAFTLKMDSKSAIALSKNPVFHDRSKHIDTRFHFIRECVEQGKIDVDFIVSDPSFGVTSCSSYQSLD